MPVYSSHNTTSRASVGSASFDTAKSHQHDLNSAAPNRVGGQTFRGWFRLLIVQVSSISTAATLTIRVSRDSGGDEMLIPDTTATIATGATTTTDGSAAFQIDVPYVDISDNDAYYVLFKTDDGTVTVDSSTFVWSD
jgi:hypothetical protein